MWNKTQDGKSNFVKTYWIFMKGFLKEFDQRCQEIRYICWKLNDVYEI